MHVLVHLALIHVADPGSAERLRAAAESDPDATRAVLRLLADEPDGAALLAAPTLLLRDRDPGRYSIGRQARPQLAGVHADGHPVYASEKRALEELVVEATPDVEAGTLALHVRLDTQEAGDGVLVPLEEDLEWRGAVPLASPPAAVGLGEDVLLVVTTEVVDGPRRR